jgi:hypothetical protein
MAKWLTAPVGSPPAASMPPKSSIRARSRSLHPGHLRKIPHHRPILPPWVWRRDDARPGRDHQQFADVDLVIIATPIDLTRIIKVNKPMQRVRYELQEIGSPRWKTCSRSSGGNWLSGPGIWRTWIGPLKKRRRPLQPLLLDSRWSSQAAAGYPAAPAEIRKPAHLRRQPGGDVGAAAGI